MLPPIVQDIVVLLLITGLIGAGVYSFLALPRQRQMKQRLEFVNTLKPGTVVLTFGGIVGTVKRVDRDTGLVTVEIAPGVEAQHVAAAITGEFDAEKYAEAARKVMK
jgi:preprotein translocase subunit YajC